jgi:hypothetical protein
MLYQSADIFPDNFKKETEEKQNGKRCSEVVQQQQGVWIHHAGER